MDDLFMFLEAVDNFLNKLTPKFSFESFLEFLEEYFDEIIRAHLLEEDCKYLGGFCNLIVMNDSLKVDTELYYEQEGQYDKHNLIGMVPLNRFNQKALEEDIEDIIQCGAYKITIEEPM